MPGIGAIYAKWYPPIIPHGTSFEGQSVLITGATSGLGLETAIHYVQLGAAHVYITARTVSKGQEAVSTIEARTGKKDMVKFLELDMDTFSGVVSFVETVKSKIEEIDTVILNAGLRLTSFELGYEGWEQTLQVNVLSTVLLALLLLPWMKTAKPKTGKLQHLDWVGSGLHTVIDIKQPQFPKTDVFKYFNQPEHFEGATTYALSKLFVMYGAAEIAKLTTNSDGSPTIIVNTMCPGIVRTSLARNYTSFLFQRILIPVFLGAFSKTAEQGSRTLVLSSLAGPEKHGEFIRYYGNPEEYVRAAKPVLSDPEGVKMQAEVWGEMLDILDAKVPGVKKIAQQS